MRYKPLPVRQFNKKAIIAGKVVEIYEYEKPVVKGIEQKRIGRSGSPFTTAETKAENRNKVAYRARSTVRRTANANPQLDKFLTLTFKENVTDISFASYEFDKFLKRLKTRFRKIEYIAVKEFQKRGAIHFHLLCNLPYVDVNELAEIWGNGFVKLNRIDNVDNVGAYITKYMSKDSLDERLVGHKCYTMSKGLKKPQEVTDEKQVEEILSNLESVKRVYFSEFESDYFGHVTYTQIICSTPPQIPQRNLKTWLREFRLGVQGRKSPVIA